ncbi:MAG: aspartate carbamoyltransferase catalytic subunit [Thermotogae bacterium]|nr:aspartate carbamoyltransferase catalytic subunit [Thermotogota bacterium]
MKHLLDIETADEGFLNQVLESAEVFLKVLQQPSKKLPTLRGKTVLMMFMEPSTRTQASFELAAKRLSADTVSFSPGRSSMRKGETFLDTLYNLHAMGIDGVVIRHSSPGAAHFVAEHTDAAVINAGDGAHEHPTQALLDAFTVKRKLGRLEGLTVLIVGDVLHSRVARSNLFLWRKFGSRVLFSGPPTLLPKEFATWGAELVDLNEVLHEVDVLMILRLQRERMEGSLVPSVREYRRFWGLTRDRLKRLPERTLLMHPGPVNWGVELDPEANDRPNTVILEQVRNGVAVRMAVLYHLLAKTEEIG